jgi:hypothetical protein
MGENDCSIRIRVKYIYIYRQEVGPLPTRQMHVLSFVTVLSLNMDGRIC